MFTCTRSSLARSTVLRIHGLDAEGVPRQLIAAHTPAEVTGEAAGDGCAHVGQEGFVELTLRFLDRGGGNGHKGRMPVTTRSPSFSPSKKAIV